MKSSTVATMCGFQEIVQGLKFIFEELSVFQSYNLLRNFSDLLLGFYYWVHCDVFILSTFLQNQYSKNLNIFLFTQLSDILVNICYVEISE